jgi:hypothetical protein
MAMLKKAATIAVLAGAGVLGSAGMAAADACGCLPAGVQGGDDHLHQEGLIAVNALNNVNVSPNLGCLANQTLPDANVESLLGLVPVGVNLNHLLQNASLNALANGNDATEVYDYSCNSNQGSSQAGNNSHGSMGAGDSRNDHTTGEDDGSYNKENGKGAGGLLGGTGILGTGL